MSIESDIEKAKESKERAELLRTLLESNLHFKKVFIDYYLESYALDLLYSKSSGKNNEMLDKKLEAISFFKDFIDEVLYLGDIAQKEIYEGYEQLRQNKEL